MFDDIEKSYRKNLSEKRFWQFYGWRAAVLVIAALVLVYWLGWNSWAVAAGLGIILLGLIFYFFWREIHRFVDKKEKHTLREKLILYHDNESYLRLNSLLLTLHKYNIYTKDDLKLVLNYFEGRQPSPTKPNVLEWIVSVMIALVSVVVIAYNESTRSIDIGKLTTILVTTASFAAVVLMPALIIAVTRAAMQTRRAKSEYILIEDLSYIIINFEKYASQLEN